jgi:hypothetical protein
MLFGVEYFVQAQVPLRVCRLKRGRLIQQALQCRRIAEYSRADSSIGSPMVIKRAEKQSNL